jgi:hypothetical protein
MIAVTTWTLSAIPSRTSVEAPSLIPTRIWTGLSFGALSLDSPVEPKT